ncbi:MULTISPECIES: ester cyclase [Cyanophyceae]|uniref:ester cyclase n=1 Tax=Cyanophyceae TaxID=3028117 RepID=UPI0016877F02|nr:MULTISPECIES: ester cyclase [Cyanophyceae]MBD1915637.1 ester cyclase [Phormidium sp. FACHB-77]MBD2031947.1 ester cyclase [Phormidium sp. FACHB-322]MBD2050697.1 ester cyclase [Leptolyngbya sp. FACHB-60]
MTDVEAQNLAIAHRFVTQFLGKGDVSIATELLDKNVQVTTGLKPSGPINGIEEYTQVFSDFYAAFPDGKPLVIEDSFAAGDRAVVRFKSFQQHVKDYFGIPKSARVITFHETHVMRIINGKIVENIVSATNLEFEMLMAPVLAPLILT